MVLREAPRVAADFGFELRGSPSFQRLFLVPLLPQLISPTVYAPAHSHPAVHLLPVQPNYKMSNGRGHQIPECLRPCTCCLPILPCRTKYGYELHDPRTLFNYQPLNRVLVMSSKVLFAPTVAYLGCFSCQEACPMTMEPLSLRQLEGMRKCRHGKP
jgi:hypothetical protein